MPFDHIDQFGFGGFEFFGEHTDKKKEASHRLAYHHQQSKDLITTYTFKATRSRGLRAEGVSQVSRQQSQCTNP
jgi:hypothetical protein